MPRRSRTAPPPTPLASAATTSTRRPSAKCASVRVPAQAGAGTPGLGGSVSFVTKSPEDYLDGSTKLYADYKFGYTSARASRMHAVTAATAINDNLKALIVAVHRNGEQLGKPEHRAAEPRRLDLGRRAGQVELDLTPGARNSTSPSTATRPGHDRLYDNKVGTSYPDGATQDSTTERTRYSIEHQYTPADGTLFDTLDTRLFSQKSKVVDLTHADYITGGQPYTRDIDTGFYNDSRRPGAGRHQATECRTAC
jgi:hemoglobin/transferrin/lactoferrin receptor protein